MTPVMIRIFHEGTEGFRRFYDSYPNDFDMGNIRLIIIGKQEHSCGQ
jgi:hypothetical protein